MLLRLKHVAPNLRRRIHASLLIELNDMKFMQAALPVMLFARGKESQDVNVNCSSLLDLHGGTDAAMAPPVSYLQKVLLPTLRRLYDINIEDQAHSRFICVKHDVRSFLSLSFSHLRW